MRLFEGREIFLTKIFMKRHFSKNNFVKILNNNDKTYKSHFRDDLGMKLNERQNLFSFRRGKEKKKMDIYICNRKHFFIIL